MAELKPEEMKKYFNEITDFVESRLNKKNNIDNAYIEEDIEALSVGTLPAKNNVKAFTYLFSDKDKKTLKEILTRSVNDNIGIGSKADLFQLQSLILRLDLKVDKDIFNFEDGKLKPGELLKIIKKAERKYLNKIKNDSIKKAIEVLEKDNKEVVTENIHSLVPNIQKEDIDRYLKRLDSVKKARAKNSKVVGSEN